MAWTVPANSGGGETFLVPAGTHIALCNMVVDLGLQPSHPNARFQKNQYQAFIGFELPNEHIEYQKDGKTHRRTADIGKFFTVSMHEKANLRKALESWRGRKFTDEEASKFDIGSIVGKGCQINVIHATKDGNVRHSIDVILGWPKGLVMPGFSQRPIYYAPDDRSMYEDLPEWLKKKVDAQIKPEEKTLVESPFAAAEVDDDIPF